MGQENLLILRSHKDCNGVIKNAICYHYDRGRCEVAEIQLDNAIGRVPPSQGDPPSLCMFAMCLSFVYVSLAMLLVDFPIGLL